MMHLTGSSVATANYFIPFLRLTWRRVRNTTGTAAQVMVAVAGEGAAEAVAAVGSADGPAEQAAAEGSAAEGSAAGFY